jgi:hypothetical protein
MKIALIIAVGVISLIVLLLGVVKLVVSRMRKSLDAEINQRWSAEEIVLKDPIADSLGQMSKGGTTKGNGGLVLTKKELHFIPVGGGGEMSIPVATINDVAIVHDFLGYHLGRPFIKVSFAGGAGPDAVAYFVPNPDEWKQKIEDAKRRQ